MTRSSTYRDSRWWMEGVRSGASTVLRSASLNSALSTKAPPLCIFFIWLVLLNRCWTTERLQRQPEEQRSLRPVLPIRWVHSPSADHLCLHIHHLLITYVFTTCWSPVSSAWDPGAEAGGLAGAMAPLCSKVCPNSVAISLFITVPSVFNLLNELSNPDSDIGETWFLLLRSSGFRWWDKIGVKLIWLNAWLVCSLYSQGSVRESG
jgi:hypothetical protein